MLSPKPSCQSKGQPVNFRAQMWEQRVWSLSRPGPDTLSSEVVAALIPGNFRGPEDTVFWTLTDRDVLRMKQGNNRG